MRCCDTGGRLAGASGRAGCGVLPGSSIRSRIVGGTNRPDGAAEAEAAAAGGASGVCASGSGSTTGSSTGGAAATCGGSCSTGAATVGGAGAGGSTTAGGAGASCRASATGASCSTSGSTCAGGGSTSVIAADAAGLTTLTRRGGPRTGAAGLAGSGFFTSAGFLAVPFAGAGCSANMSPPGSDMLRWRATRSTNDRATTSSIVLDALFSSMP